jgi:hypothetical protein
LNASPFSRAVISHENCRKVVLAGLPTLEEEAGNVIRTVEMYEKRRCSS